QMECRLMRLNEHVATGPAATAVEDGFKNGDHAPSEDLTTRPPLFRPRSTPESAARACVLHGIFEAQADARPDAIAVIFGCEETTYAAIESRANRLARHLRARGVRRGSIVALLLPRCTDAYVALLGILKAGAAYVPIDPEYPTHRVAHILENSRAGTLVTMANLMEKQGAFGGVVVCMDADCEE